MGSGGWLIPSAAHSSAMSPSQMHRLRKARKVNAHLRALARETQRMERLLQRMSGTVELTEPGPRVH